MWDLSSNLDQANQQGQPRTWGRNWLPRAKWWFNYRAHLTDAGVWLGLARDLWRFKMTFHRNACRAEEELVSIRLLAARPGFVVVVVVFVFKDIKKGKFSGAVFLGSGVLGIINGGCWPWKNKRPSRINSLWMAQQRLFSDLADLLNQLQVF